MAKLTKKTNRLHLKLTKKERDLLVSILLRIDTLCKRVGLFSRRAIGCNTDEHWAIAYH